MMNKNEIVQAIQRDGYVVLTLGGERKVFVWKRDKWGEDVFFSNCPFINQCRSKEICLACLRLDDIMPIEEDESDCGAFVLADKETVRRAELNNQI